MNKYIYIGFLFLLMACQKEGIVSFDQEKDCIQFNYNLEKDEMQYEYNFADQSITGEDQWGYPMTIYLGDSILRDTISLHLALMGHASDVDREFKLKTVAVTELDTLPLATVEFYPSYTFRANRLLDTIQVILIRPETRGKFAVGVTFDFEDGNAIFDSGAEELSVYQLIILDSYEKPSQWDMQKSYLGEYSEEKYAFMVTVLQAKFSPWADWAANNKILRANLDKFNSEHPNAPKDFTFPVYTKPTWWDNYMGAGTYLGEYSTEKEDFVISVIGEDNYYAWTPWAEYMPELREAYDTYNTGHPNDPLPFPPFPADPEVPEKDK